MHLGMRYCINFPLSHFEQYLELLKRWQMFFLELLKGLPYISYYYLGKYVN